MFEGDLFEDCIFGSMTDGIHHPITYFGFSNNNDCGWIYFCVGTCIWCNINSIDVVLGDYNNHGWNINWYGIIDIPSVPHEEDFDSSVDNNHNIDDYIQRKTIGDNIIQMKTITGHKDFDRFCVYDGLWMQMNWSQMTSE